MEAERPVNMFNFIKLCSAFSQIHTKCTYRHFAYHKIETLAFSGNYKYITYIKISFLEGKNMNTTSINIQALFQFVSYSKAKSQHFGF